MQLNHNLSDDEVIRAVYAKSNLSPTELILLSRFEKLIVRHETAIRELATAEAHLSNCTELIWAEGK